MEQPTTQPVEKKEAGIGWGTIFAGIAIIGTVIGAVTGLSHLNEQPIPDVSHNSIDSVFEMKKQLMTHEQFGEKAKGAGNAIGGAINEALEGADNLRKSGGTGLADLGNTLVGKGSIDDARIAIANTFVELDKNAMGSKEVQDFIASDKRAIFYGNEGGMLLEKDGAVLYASGEKLKQIDPKILGGLIPGGKQLIEGLNPNAFSEIKGAGAAAEKAHEEAKRAIIGRAFSVGTVASAIGWGLKKAEENHEAKIAVGDAVNNVAPTMRIDTAGREHLRLAVGAKQVNDLAFAGRG